MKIFFLILGFFSSASFGVSDHFARELIGEYSLILDSGSFDKLNENQRCQQNMRLTYFTDGNEVCRRGIAMLDVSFCNPDILIGSADSGKLVGVNSHPLLLSRVSTDAVQNGGFILLKTKGGVDFIIKPSTGYYSDKSELTALCHYKKVYLKR